MKATVEVKDRREAEALRTGLDDPAVRAFVMVAGLLLPLTPRSRARVMSYVADKLDEDQEIATLADKDKDGGG